MRGDCRVTQDVLEGLHLRAAKLLGKKDVWVALLAVTRVRSCNYMDELMMNEYIGKLL